jgi:cytochrome c-type biogenesis protein CcmH/NrfF
MHEALLVPLAHAGHWLWLLYLPPILIVLGSIIWSVVVQRRESGKEAERV